MRLRTLDGRTVKTRGWELRWIRIITPFVSEIVAGRYGRQLIKIACLIALLLKEKINGSILRGSGIAVIRCWFPRKVLLGHGSPRVAVMKIAICTRVFL